MFLEIFNPSLYDAAIFAMKVNGILVDKSNKGF